MSPEFEPLFGYSSMSVHDMQQAALENLERMRRRRSVRDFSPVPIPDSVIESCLKAAGTAPSGANLQPWHFAVVRSPEVKHRIRIAAEAEEREFYEQRAPQEWLDALAPLGTDANKPFLEVAPCLIVIFAKAYDLLPDGRRVKNYYVSESVGIATGFLIQALHQAGLATLTHTPSPMAFLNEILDRPSNERPTILLVVGFPSENAMVPKIGKKTLAEFASFH
ncbi:MAG: nitroreductase family protein [Planctomycetaceae bacterium]|nr:nitroreductase family protein [Planctomycetaceae bacterium]